MSGTSKAAVRRIMKQFFEDTTDLTRDEQAELLDVSPNTVSRWANGHRMPRNGALKRMQRLIGTRQAPQQELDLETARKPKPRGSSPERAAKKRADFLRLANKRVPEIVHRMRNLAHLGNRSNYDYDEAHVEQILSTLRDAVSDVEKAFHHGEDTSSGFQLK